MLTWRRWYDVRAIESADRAMNLFYLLSVVSSRFLNVLTVIILSYLLSAKSFGQYSLVTTNAMLINLIFTSWVSGSMWRDASRASDEEYKHYVAAAIKYAALMGTICLCIAPILFSSLGRDEKYFSVTFALAPLIMITDLILVALNSRHEARIYSLLSFLRGAFSLGVAAMLIEVGWGLWGALAGQVLGIVFALVLLRDVRKMFVDFPAAPLVWTEIWGKFKFGIVSAMALNFYMVANALCRNYIAYKLGEAQAGYYSLAVDMFFAPVALFAISLSLSNIPTLYRVDGTSGNDPKAQKSSEFIMANLAVALPYAIGGGLLAPRLAQMMLSHDMAAAVSEIAGYGAVQGACFAILGALSTLALTAEKTKLSLIFSLFIITTTFLAMALAGSFATLESYSAAVTLSLVLTSLGSLVLVKPLFGVALPARELAKIGGAAAIMLGALVLMMRLGHGLIITLGGIILGGTLYLTVAVLCRSRAVGGILRMRFI